MRNSVQVCRLLIFFYCNVQVSTGGVRALDGLVGAVIFDGKSFITSANAEYIPLPPFGDRHVKLRADSRYGDDDPVQWPQPYNTYHSHLAAIPRPNTLLDHQIIWWTPTIADFSCPPHNGPVSGLWKLRQPIYNELRTSVIFLTDRVTKYQQSIPAERSSPILQPSVKWLQQVLDQLHSVQMSFRHIQFVVRDLQRVWLHVWAVLHYMQIYKPRMDGVAVPGDGVADTIGTFTSSIRVAQDMFVAGLPCWLIRSSKEFGDEKIFRVAEIFHPNDYVVLEPHKFAYPVIFEGPATSLEKYRAIESFARNFLCTQDPFAMSCTSSSSVGASQPPTLSTPSTSSTPSVASTSATQHSTGRASRGVIRRPARGRGAGKSSDIYDTLLYLIVRKGSHQLPRNHGRNKFKSITDLPISPLSISAWDSALADVNDDPSCVDERYRSANDRKYVFPEPGIFLGANPGRRAKYLLTWQAIEPACIHRLLSSTAPPLSNQEWRDILVGSLEFRSSESACAKARDHACRLLGSAIDDLHLNVADPATPPPPPINDREAQAMLWRLSELNFRFELLTLHKRAGPEGRNAVECDQAVRDALQLTSLQAVDMGTSIEGIHSVDWQSRLPSLLRLATLMRVWSGDKPLPLLQDKPLVEYTELDARVLEDAVARFYTDTFFIFFGRAAVIPTRLP